MVLERVLPFFLLIGAGWLIARLRLLSEEGAGGLSAYVYWLGFPVLLIHAIGLGPSAAPGALTAAAVYAGALLLLVGVVWAGWRIAKGPETDSAVSAMAAGLGNTAFLGLPLTVSVFGPDAAGIAAAVVAVEFTLVLAVAAALVAASTGASARGAAVKALGNPVAIGAGLGVLVAVLHPAVPETLERTLGLIAATASPVALVALGAMLARAPIGKGLFAPALVVAAAVKLVAWPLVAFGLMRLIGAEPLVTAVVTTLAACPTAVSVFVQCRAYDAAPELAARIVALTTLASVATLPLAAWAVSL